MVFARLASYPAVDSAIQSADDNSYEKTKEDAMRTRALMAALFTVTAVAAAADDATSQPAVRSPIVMEYVGQVVNGIPTPAGSQQYGNLLSVAGADPSLTFTFYTAAATTAVVPNGPLRIIERAGTTAVYLAPAAGTFDNPDGFRAGIPVQVSSIIGVLPSQFSQLPTFDEIKRTSRSREVMVEPLEQVRGGGTYLFAPLR